MDKSVLIHLDYHPLNVMTDGTAVTGVIDWENVRLGDARYDVARSLSMLCVDLNVRAFPKPLQQVVRVFRRGYLRGYKSVMGEESLTVLAPFLAWLGRFMLDDLGSRCSPGQAQRIERWTAWWQRCG